jgi:hypothetical protein
MSNSLKYLGHPLVLDCGGNVLLATRVTRVTTLARYLVAPIMRLTTRLIVEQNKVLLGILDGVQGEVLGWCRQGES